MCQAGPKKSIEAGDFVIIDFGCEIDGFKSDITRTVIFGEPTQKHRHLYELVKDANAIACRSMKPNMKASDLDKLIRDRLTAAGYKNEFSHSLGHGLGLGIHELPRIGEDSKDRIPPFSVVAIEPGVYMPNFGGVRIEDNVVFNETGPELLSHIDRELIAIE
ncbi:MAG: M24 family metallopeptidase [Phycisphaerae bacterium]